MVERSLSFRVRQILCLVLFVMFTFGPISRAYADGFEGGGGSSSSFNNSFGTVWYGPTGSGGAANILYVRYGVVANTKYDAALYCCKGSSFDLSKLTNTQKGKLLKKNGFKDFADLFSVGKPQLTNDWGGDASIVQAWDSARQLYGETYCWNARYTNDQKIDAQNDIEDVLNDDDTPSGGGTGGGSSTGNGTPEDNGNTVTLTFSNVYFCSEPNESNIHYLINGTSYYFNTISEPLIGRPIKVRLNKTLYEQIISHDRYYIGLYTGSRQNYPRLYFGYIGNSNSNVEWKSKSGYDNGYKYFYFTGDLWYEKVITLSYDDDTYNNDSPLFYNTTENNVTFSEQSNGPLYSSSPVIAAIIVNGNSGGDGGGDTVPPTEWPSPPTETPKPPDVPTPGDPVGPNPWIPIPDDDVDITGDDFQDLLDALNEHCIHLQNSIETNVSQLWDLQSDLLSSLFDDLKSYLHELFEWLSEQLNFDVTVEGGQYDDTSVIYWLKQIWSRLPTGINTKPSDPVTNPDGWWDWLTQLLNNLAADLMALGHDRLAGVLETLNQLRNKFPFSLPWDVAALLGLLVGPAVCPEFDVPCYTITTGMQLQQVGTYHLTLEPYETVWQGVRWIEILAFAVYLIMNTSNLMDMVQRTVRPR